MGSNLSKYRTRVSQLIVAQAQEGHFGCCFFCLRSSLIQGLNVTLSATPINA